MKNAASQLITFLKNIGKALFKPKPEPVIGRQALVYYPKGPKLTSTVVKPTAKLDGPAKRPSRPKQLRGRYTAKTSNERQISKFAKDKMKQWGLHDWTFRFNTHRSAYGMCYCDRNAIELSRFLLPTLSLDERKDVVLHEIAHALNWIDECKQFRQRFGYDIVAGEHAPMGYRWRRSHGAEWLEWCVKVGAKPQRCGPAGDAEIIKDKSKYVLTCSKGHVRVRHKIKESSAVGAYCRCGELLRMEANY